MTTYFYNTAAYFDKVTSATGKKYYIERSISGYYRLMLDEEPVFDDSAAEEVNEDRETAEAFFANYLLEYIVPDNKKTIKNGIITLLQQQSTQPSTIRQVNTLWRNF